MMPEPPVLESAAAPPVQYKRRRAPLLGRRRRLSLRWKHVVLWIFIQAALFAGVQRLCFFLLDWDRLRLTSVDIRPLSEPVHRLAEAEVRRCLSANLLALDTRRLASRLLAIPWIREVKIRKVYPSSLRVEMDVRQPMAVLDRGGLYLIDREGVVLDRAVIEDTLSLPLLEDEKAFSTDFEEKIALARSCLESLSVPLRRRVSSLDLSDPTCLSVVLREESVRLLLGRDGFQAKIELYEQQAGSWGAAFGILESVDFRIPGRTYLRPRPGGNDRAARAAEGEVM